MSSLETDQPVVAAAEDPAETPIRHTIDCKPRDERKIQRLEELFDGASVAETIRACVRIVHAQAEFVHAKKGNRIVMESADGKDNKVLLALEILMISAEE